MNAASERLGAALDRVRSYDRPLLIIAAALFALGILFSMAASPAATARIRIEEAFYFAGRQAAYAAVGVMVMLGAAALDPRQVRRMATILAAIMLPLCALAALFGPEIKGAQRWFDFGVFSLQPSEILKPALIVVWAWMLGESMKQRQFPGRLVSLGLFALAAAALLAQPDVGQTALLALCLAPLLALSGIALRWMLGAGVLASVSAWAIYRFYPHARERVDTWLNPEGDGAYQVNRALDAIAAGGVFGRGPGEGIIKRSLPDAHADFVFAVASEEFGLLASLGLIALFGALAFRGLSRASRLNEPFEQLAAAGLITLLVLQASIHIAVNLSLLPAKGMTLPFISFGGSSMIGSALALGFCLSLLRNRPGAYLFAGRGT
ncbi:MAG TPA: putative peptidoglycan glycosyltransferase FtsW [Vitreimonas sp.]|uniref:FtsW/RodA/SpoVE family cell cycle protein n=1 Tax=Vitreimonas sp. TaxID=3069702 RepID=UPI002D517652|nr:putative peptidoglycan glycosyltransferase FtsW [Vitreimonas sp.]HYD86572.1 putative peptidoglycan glycosyltransferase FtsW [Vitreimonas sp.]